MSEKLTMHQAFDLFEEHITDIENAAHENMRWRLEQLVRPKPNMTASLFWVKANMYILFKEKVTNQYKSVLRTISMRRQPKTKDTITQEHIERAKEYPIENLLTESLVRGMARCPLHVEKTASFQVRKDNSFVCWGCQQHGDAIDLYKIIHNTDFISAVKALQ